MARYKTKKQKKKSDYRKPVAKETVAAPIKKTNNIAVSEKSKTSVFSQTQVNLLYKDLLKTVVVTVVVFTVLLSIFMYMR